MEITMDAASIKDLIDAVELAGGDEMRAKTDARIVEKGAAQAAQIMESKVPRARDNSTSGRAGSRPTHGHAAANVPIGKPKKTDSGASAKVGWTLDDNSEYFYMKFVNWGTLKMPPRDFVNQTAQAVEPLLSSIAAEEYAETLKQTLGRYE